MYRKTGGFGTPVHEAYSKHRNVGLLELEFPRFRGHPISWEKGVYDGKETIAVSAPL